MPSTHRTKEVARPYRHFKQKWRAPRACQSSPFHHQLSQNVSSLSEELKKGGGILVRLRKRDDRGLLEELRPDELQLLFGNVGIFDAGDCRVVVGDLRLERVLLRCQTVGKPAQVRCHLADVVECGGKTGERRLDVRGAEDPQVARRDTVERLEIET
jgi:hypothetical protein